MSVVSSHSTLNRRRQLNYYKKEVQLKPKRSLHNYEKYICFAGWDEKSSKKKEKIE